MHLFLHGFLGQKEDWDPVLAHLPSSLSTKAINLPGHGGQPVAEDVALAVKEQVGQADTLIGYSAGGRVALELKSRFPDDYGQVIAISAHPGIVDIQERAKRFEEDRKWIELLKEGSFEEFLQKWYAQALFAPLSPSTFARRTKQKPEHLAHFLEHYSTGKKIPPELFPGTFFICGKEDLKYVQLYRTLPQSMRIILLENGYHALHLDQPERIANIITKVIHEYC